MLEIRTDAKDLVDRLERGESFRITYRNKPVGEIYPLQQQEGISREDPIYSIDETATPLLVRGASTSFHRSSRESCVPRLCKRSPSAGAFLRKRSITFSTTGAKGIHSPT